MDDNILRYTLRVNRTLFQKFRYVADYEGRSANREIERSISERAFLIKQNNFQLSIYTRNFPITATASA